MVSFPFEIRRKLASYIAGEISLDEFDDWFAVASWDVRLREPQWVVDIVFEIELWLAEFSDGIWNEQELKKNLSQVGFA